jgi:hypothetical protein
LIKPIKKNRNPTGYNITPFLIPPSVMSSNI